MVHYPEAGTQHQRLALSALKTGPHHQAPHERVADAVKGGAGRVQLGAASAAVTQNVQLSKVSVYQVSSFCTDEIQSFLLLLLH